MTIRTWKCLAVFVVTMTLTQCSRPRKSGSFSTLQGPTSQIYAVTVANSNGATDDPSQWQSLCGEFPPNIVNCAFKRNDWNYWSGSYGGGSANGHLLTWVVNPDPSSGASYQIEYTTMYQSRQGK